MRLGQLQCKPPRAKAARTLSQPEPAVKRPAPYGLSLEPKHAYWKSMLKNYGRGQREPDKS